MDISNLHRYYNFSKDHDMAILLTIIINFRTGIIIISTKLRKVKKTIINLFIHFGTN